MSAKRKVFISIGIFVVILLAAAIITPFFVNADTFRPQIEQALGGMLGRKVDIGHLRVSIWSGGLVANRIAIADDPAYSRQPFLTAQSFSVGVDLWPLIMSRRLQAHSVTIADPHVQLLRTANGNWNFASIGGKTPAEPRRDPSSSGVGLNGFTVDRISISNGTIAFGHAGEPTRLAYDHVNITAQNLSDTSAFPLAFDADTPGDGKLSLRANVGPLGAANANRLPFQGQMKAEKVPAQDVQNLLAVLGYALPEGSSLQGGTIKADLTLHGPLERFVTSGPVQLSNVKLAGFSLPARLAAALGNAGAATGNDTMIQLASSRLRYAPDGVRADELDIVIPMIGTITGDGTVDPQNRLYFRLIAKLASGSPIAQLASRLPLFSQISGGMNAGNAGSGAGSAGGFSLPFRIEGTTSHPQVIPDVGSVAGQALKQMIPGQQKQGGLGSILNQLLNKKKKPQQQPQ